MQLNDGPAGAYRWRTHRLLVLVTVVLFLVACGGDDDAPATPAEGSTTVSTATPADGGSSAPPTPATTEATEPAGQDTPPPDGPPTAANVFAHIEALVLGVGVRSAGTEGERAGAEYIRGVLEGAGYLVEIEEFETRAPYDDSEFDADARSFAVFALGGSANARGSGPLVLAGIGTPGELSAAGVEGAIAVVDRGTLQFGEKAQNAEAAGAIGLVVVNTEAGPLFGTLGDFRSGIPVVGVELGVRAELHALIEVGVQGTVAADAGTRNVRSQNVVATDGDVEACRVLIGGHYDSVLAGPGANDNASGTAVAIELALHYRRPGLCFVAFGAEEIGLFGSRAFVSDHGLDALEDVLNIDMAGKIDRAVIVGDADLTARVVAALDAAGGDFPIRAGAFGPFASSDHASFERVGIPAITINSGLDAGVIHTAQDDIENIRFADLEVMLQISDIAVRALLPQLDR